MQAAGGSLALLVLVEQQLQPEEANADGGGGDDRVIGDDVQDAGMVVLRVVVHLRRHLRRHGRRVQLRELLRLWIIRHALELADELIGDVLQLRGAELLIGLERIRHDCYSFAGISARQK